MSGFGFTKNGKINMKRYIDEMLIFFKNKNHKYFSCQRQSFSERNFY